ncbi:hypothetical protein [Rosettibacter firmus]|uniref:hypothetical protein n=1 Tax=Rosettibacter firmus TaxID=3111522 RepID=UPI00336C06CB
MKKLWKQLLYITIIFFILLNKKLYSQNDDLINNPELAFGFEIASQTKYLWHGLPLDNGFVMQPDLWFSYDNFTIEFWGNYVVNDKSSFDSTRNHEFDIYLYYDFSLTENISIQPKLNYYKYLYEEFTPSTMELSLSLDYKINDYLTIKNEIYADVLNYKGISYGAHLLEFFKELNNYLQIKSTAGIIWGNKKFFDTNFEISKDLNISHFQLYLEILYHISENFSVVPFIDYYLESDHKLRSLYKENLINSGIKVQFEL